MPHKPVSLQLWILVHMGFPIEQLVATLIKLIGEIGWTTLPAEQQHGSLASFRRWRPEFGLESLVSRACLLQLRRRLPSLSDDEKQLARLTRRWQCLSATSPSKTHGRQLYVSELREHLRDRAGGHSAREVPTGVA